MKARTILCALAATMMLFVGCGKDDENNNTAAEAAVNTLVVNGKVYQLSSHYQMGVGRTYAGAETVDLNANGDPLYTITADVEDVTLNQTYTYPDIPGGGELFWGIHDANWDFQIGAPELTEGTITISRTDDLFVYKVNGSRDGLTVSFNITVPASEWEEVVYDR